MTKPISKDEKDAAEKLLDRNQYLVRKIEYYQNSRWRRLKFWWKKKWKENPFECVKLILGVTIAIGAVITLLIVWYVKSQP